ncbi:MAG: hypothetical protein K0B00_10865 [Rhodobacteraceae bacterium]|nr:hypothetical protein [Paracoccaceae bacterium]
MRQFLAVLALVILSGSGASALCVANGANAAYVFTVENATGSRARATLAPGAELCLSVQAAPGAEMALPGGVVAVFERIDSVEGCSRVVHGSQSETLLAYGAFDRCRWAPHG